MRKTTSKSGFTLVELLVVIGIIGVVVALMLPGVQAAREAARKTDCVNRVRQLALATHMHHNTYRYFPPARYESRPDADPTDQCGLETPTWLARIMPFIEQVELGSRWDFSKPWHEHEDKVRNVVPDIFLCPSRRSGTQPVGTRSLRTTVSGGGGRLPCGCPVPARTEVKDLDVTGALCDYAGNHGDLTPGATGAPTDFYFGGNGTGVISVSGPNVNPGKPLHPRIVFVWLPSRMAHRTHSSLERSLFPPQRSRNFHSIPQLTTGITSQHPVDSLDLACVSHMAQMTYLPICSHLGAGTPAAYTLLWWTAAPVSMPQKRTRKSLARWRIVETRESLR